MTNADPRNLQDLALLAVQRHDGASGRGLAALAKREGYVLSHTTANRIISGAYMSRPSTETVEALAHLAGVPRRIAYEASGLAFPLAPLADQLPAGADSLTAGQRRVIIDLAREFVSYNEKTNELGRELAALREDDGDATQAENEAGRGQGVPGVGDRTPMSLAQARQIKDDAAAFGGQRRRGDMGGPDFTDMAADDSPSEGRRAADAARDLGEGPQ